MSKPVYPFAAGAASQQSSRGLPSGPAAPRQPGLRPGQPQPGNPAPRGYPSPSPGAQSSASNLLPPSARGPQPFSGKPRVGSLASASSSQTSLASRDPFSSSSLSLAPSLSEKYSLSPDPSSWGAALHLNQPEADDFLHNPDPKRDRKNDKGGSVFTTRGFANLGCIFILGAALVGLFAGYPIVGYFTRPKQPTLGAFNIGGTNLTGQVPSMEGNFGLIDRDTPQAAYTITSLQDKTEWDLVFSDEFNVDGRSFYPGDDPFWEAVDLHYWGTNNLEWYDPSAVTTEGGSLKITLSQQRNHDLDYMGGLISSWNKFCFTGGMIVSSVSLPGRSNVYGLWPAVWTMGNLGRAGYGASLEGMWPYSYEACDVGTMPNQTRNGEPLAALINGDEGNGGVLSYLPGQRLSSCTCPGEDHPGPILPDGTFQGRAAPEIDVIEAQVDAGTRIGHVSQSCQWAPFNAAYEWFNATNLIIDDPTVTELNGYKGGVFQQATSAVSITDQNCYHDMPNACFSVYGFEYKPGYEQDGAYITWINDNKPAWTLLAAGMGRDDRVEIAARPIPREPMYMIVNLGISRNFGPLDEENLEFPAIMLVDYIRVYQPKDQYNIGCSPPDFPTEEYINRHIDSYTNPNLTTWAQNGQTFPRSSYKGEC